MTKFHRALNVGLIAGAALVAAPALAQNAAQATTPQASGTAAASVAVSDAEVKSFAKAALAVDQVNKDSSITAADKGKKLSEVVTGAGLQPERFNQIANASGSDAALQKRIQDAIVAERGAAPAAAPAPAQSR